MNDQTIPAADIRAWRDKYRGCTGNNALEALDALLPAAPRPTLADMTEEERLACQWMQADIIGGDEPLVITRIDRTDWSAVILDRNGRLDGVPAGHVTPRPDLPRLEWPGTEEVAPAPAPDKPSLPGGWRLADHPDYGRVIVTSASPDADGYAYFVSSATGPIGNDWHLCDPDELTYLDQEAADATD